MITFFSPPLVFMENKNHFDHIGGLEPPSPHAVGVYHVNIYMALFSFFTSAENS